MRFHEKDFAVAYDQRLASEKYPGILLDKIISHLPFNATILDCGAGSGFFTVPLAERGHKMTAIDPSLPMLQILKSKLKQPGVGEGDKHLSVEIVHQHWEDYSGPGAEYCICIHAIYPLKDPVRAVKKMASLCEKTLLIVRDTQRMSFTISQRIREALSISSSYSRNPLDVSTILRLEDITFTSENIIQKRTSTFIDLEEESRYYMYHLNLPSSSFPKVKKVLKALSVHTARGYEIEQTYHDVIYKF